MRNQGLQICIADRPRIIFPLDQIKSVIRDLHAFLCNNIRYVIQIFRIPSVNAPKGILHKIIKGFSCVMTHLGFSVLPFPW